MCSVEKIEVLDTKKEYTDKDSGVYCFATSVYSEETDTDINLSLQAVIELQKRQGKGKGKSPLLPV